MKATLTCSIEGCDNSHIVGWGMCGKHYARWRRTGDPENDHRQKFDPICSYPGCDQPHRAHGLCTKHVTRLTRYGDPSVSRRPPRLGPEHHLFKGDDIAYLAAHARVVRRFGRAKDHQCAQCDNQAFDWAYNHAAEVELTDDQGRVYSGDPGDYMPLCRSCHLYFDRGVHDDAALG